MDALSEYAGCDSTADFDCRNTATNVSIGLTPSNNPVETRTGYE
jgi:hypothetical protein